MEHRDCICHRRRIKRGFCLLESAFKATQIAEEPKGLAKPPRLIVIEGGKKSKPKFMQVKYAQSLDWMILISVIRLPTMRIPRDSDPCRSMSPQ